MEHAHEQYQFYTQEGHEQPYYHAQPQMQAQYHARQQLDQQLPQQHPYYPYYNTQQQQQPPSPSHVTPLPIEPSPPPPSPDQMYSDSPISPQLSDTSADGLYSPHPSPTSSRANSLSQRGHHHRAYNPTPSPTGSISRRRRGRSQDSDDDEGFGYADVATNRKEATRKQRIEAEQRRRDELRDGYAKLKEVLPVSNQKSSKVSLLDRATTHIAALELENKSLNERIVALEDEIRRLQAVNDKLASGALETPSPGMYERPLSPPPDAPVGMLMPAAPSTFVGAPDDASSVTTPSDGGY
ncbi:BHLH domain-containing protein [Mycena kentingensis (nom. inval.)]|nr:BHLH domain-containing protein [Mycena kentingensis (nom. inval.)]